MRRRMPVKAVKQIWLDPQPQGTRAVYLVEARNEEEAREVSNLFAELETDLQVRQLSQGKLFSYAVKIRQDQQATLAELEFALRSNFGFVILHRSFDEVIYKIVDELCADTGSQLLPIPRCNICGKIEPFPDTVVNLADQGGETIASGAYCGTCTAASSARSNKEFLLSLLLADTRDFSALEDMQFVRAKSQKQSIKFRIQSRAEQIRAVNN
ncbi:MAG: hypothetical protein Q7N50_05735 [Armatimonadota bacterium]|nr:hypothetical protein [Armatimonadota bacterium]